MKTSYLTFSLYNYPDDKVKRISEVMTRAMVNEMKAIEIEDTQDDTLIIEAQTVQDLFTN